jgi:hypothetical protein
LPLLLPLSLVEEKKKKKKRKPGTLPSSSLIRRKNLGPLLHSLPVVPAALLSSARAPMPSLPSLAPRTGRPIWHNALERFRLLLAVTMRGETVLGTNALLFRGSLLGLVQTATMVVKALVVLFVPISLTYILLFHLLVIHLFHFFDNFKSLSGLGLDFWVTFRWFLGKVLRFPRSHLKLIRKTLENTYKVFKN